MLLRRAVRLGVPRALGVRALSAPAAMPSTLAALRREAERVLDEGRELTQPPVTAHGWVVSARRQKTRTFLELNDGTLGGDATLQVVLHGDVRDVAPGQAVCLHGAMKRGRGQRRSQRVELHADRVDVLADSDLATYPLANVMQRHAQPHDSAIVDIVRRESHLKARTPRFAAIARTRARMELAIAAWFAENDFCKVVPPIITASDCEGGGEIFRVVADADVRQRDGLAAFWSGHDAYLTVSAQLHLEAFALGLSRVWSLCPVFRAEGSATNRHLAEFWMCEAELCWLPPDAAGLHRVLDCAEHVIKRTLHAAWDGERAHDDMTFLGAEPHAAWLSELWPRIPYTEAVRLLRAHHAAPPVWGDSLRSEHERWLADHFASPVFVTDYPSGSKPFYMRENRAKTTLTPDLDPGRAGAEEATVACFDLLVPGVGELVGGSVREERLDVLQARMAQAGLQASGLQWYTDDLRRYGGAPHGGFGLGMERLLSWATHTEHVRDLVGFPRVKGPLRY